MRDAGKVKNKFEIKLDTNQVFFLFAGLATWTALAFVVGIVVGRAKKPVDTTQAVATVALPDASPSPAKKIEDRLAAAQPKATEEPELPLGDVMTHLESATPGNAAPTPKPGASKAKASETAVARATPTAKPEATAKPEPTAKAEATAKPETTAKPAATAVAKGTGDGAPVAKEGAFTLQVVAYNDAAQAETQVAALKAKGFDAYAVTAQVPGKGTIHRVRVGRYPTRGAAETAATSLAAAQPGTKPLVVSFE